ncbi:MAG: glycosyltransferase family 87 protein [Microgenomates group bacterium]
MNRIKFKIGTIIIFLIILSLSARSLCRIISTNAPDFNVLWLAAKDLSTDSNPYLNPDIFTGVGYPPNTLLFYLPLMAFPYKVAQAIFVLLIFASTVGAVYLSLKIVLKKVPWQVSLLALSLTFLSFPTKFTLGMGQNNTVAFFTLLFAYYFYKQKRISLAGVLLGISIAFKTVFGFFLLFFLLKREWKTILYSLLPIGLSIFLVALISDVNLYEFYIKEVVPPLLNLSSREIYYNQGLVGFIARLSGNLILRRYATISISAVLVAITSFFALKRKSQDLQFSLFVTTLLLVDTLSWQHHFIWLVFPFVLLTAHAVKKKQIEPLVLIGISYLLVSWNFKNPSQFSNFPISLILSNTFYGGLILYLLNIQLLLKPKE